MPDVLLDTSYLSFLSDARRHDPSSFGRFLKVWRRDKWRLVFTTTHVRETWGISDIDHRQARAHLVADLIPLRMERDFDVVATAIREGREVTAEVGGTVLTLPERELMAALMRIGSICAEGDGATDWVISHSSVASYPVVDRAAIVSLLSHDDDPAVHTILKHTRIAERLAAQARSRSPGVQFHSPKISAISDVPLDENEVNQALAKFREAFAAINTTHLDHHFSDIAQDGLDVHIGKIEAMIRRAGKVGMRQAYLDVAGLRYNPRDRRTIERACAEGVLRQLAMNLLERMFGAIDGTVQLPSLTDCPGMFLRHLVEIEALHNESAPEPTNDRDLDIIAYLPHVDHAFFDARMRAYTMQVLRRVHQNGTPECLLRCPLPGRRCSSITALQTELERLVEVPGSGLRRN